MAPISSGPSFRPPTAEIYAEAMAKSFSGLPMGFNYSSSFRWTAVENPLTFAELGEMGYKFIFITLGAIHAAMYGEWNFLQDLAKNQEEAQFRLQSLKNGHPTENHHVMGEERYSVTEGFGARGFSAKEVL